MPSASVELNGIRRDFITTVPSSYRNHDPSPLIVAFHGRTNSNEQVKSYMRLDRNATDSIIAYPAAIKNGNGTYSWADPGNKAYEVRDIAFFDALVEKLASDYCIDMDRVSVVGHSLGAWMANSIACVRGGAVMASATVGGDSVVTKCAGPAAAMIIHNPKDNLAPFSGAESVRTIRTETNFCGWETEDTGPTELKCVTHKGCASGSDVVFCPHTIDTDERGKFYPHTWPRSAGEIIAEWLRGVE